MIDIEPLAGDYVRPAQPPCPDCSCCTAVLCARGRMSPGRCHSHTAPDTWETVVDCPCSAETTPGTYAWRVAQVRVVRLALEAPLLPHEEDLLRTIVTDGGPFTAEVTRLSRLTVQGLARWTDDGAVATPLGARYLAARTEARTVTGLEVRSVSSHERTASVAVIGWRADEPVTVLLDQLVADTGLSAAELSADPWLEAEVNCGAARADDLVITNVRQILRPTEPWPGGDR